MYELKNVFKGSKGIELENNCSMIIVGFIFWLSSEAFQLQL